MLLLGARARRGGLRRREGGCDDRVHGCSGRRRRLLPIPAGTRSRRSSPLPARRRAGPMWALLDDLEQGTARPDAGRLQRAMPRARGGRRRLRAASRVIVSERVTPEFGVVAIDGRSDFEGNRERGVYAVALRLEGKAWKIELGGHGGGAPDRARPRSSRTRRRAGRRCGRRTRRDAGRPSCTSTARP